MFRISDTLGNVDPLTVSNPINFTHLFTRLKTDFEVNRLTIQSGGELNSHFVRAGLIDRVSLVVALNGFKRIVMIVIIVSTISFMKMVGLRHTSDH